MIFLLLYGCKLRDVFSELQTRTELFPQFKFEKSCRSNFVNEEKNKNTQRKQNGKMSYMKIFLSTKISIKKDYIYMYMSIYKIIINVSATDDHYCLIKCTDLIKCFLSRPLKMTWRAIFGPRALSLTLVLTGLYIKVHTKYV